MHVIDEETNSYIQGGVQKYRFKETHPGHKFSHLIQLKLPSIPRIALPKEKLCPLHELDLKCASPLQHVVGKREMYAKITLFEEICLSGGSNSPVVRGIMPERRE